MEYTIAAYTDTGIQKASNQDSLCIRRAALPRGGEVVLAVVCDGMGGLQRGELASAEGVRRLGDWFDRRLPQLGTLHGGDFGWVQREWIGLFEGLHRQLLNYSAAHQVQLGTTLAAFLACGDRFLIVSIGDSRVYERWNRLRQLTQDQSLVAREVANGRITPEQARRHPQRNVLLQCLGAGDTVVPAFGQGLVHSGALYLLCTDGLVHELSPEELEGTLAPLQLRGKERMTEALTCLTELCKDRGETDNITAVLISAEESQQDPSTRGLGGLLRRLPVHHRGTDQETPGPLLLETAQVVHTQERLGGQ